MSQSKQEQGCFTTPSCPNCQRNDEGLETVPDEVSGKDFFCHCCHYRWDRGEDASEDTRVHRGPGEVSKRVQAICRSNYKASTNFPRGEFRQKQLTYEQKQLFHQIRVDSDVFWKTRKLEDQDNGWYWMGKTKFYEWIDSNLPDRPTTPCGRTGVTCVESGKKYTCTKDECDCEFGPKQAEEVMKG